MSSVEFDAIVVGSGISGGWAAKELAEKGLRVLVLERGSALEHQKDYTGEHKAPWEVPFAGKPMRELYKEEYPIQSKVYAFSELNRHFWNNDKDNPYDYDESNPFLWQRADVVGGRSLLWGRQVYRWSDLDFSANKKDGHGIDWPIRYKDIAPWYSYVEKFIGISGQAEGLSQLPDGEFLPPMEMNAGEKHVKAAIEAHYPDRRMTIGRVAVLTKNHNGRAACHYCGPCHNGCSTGSYFSSQSSTLPAAQATGRMTLRPDSVVESLEYDATSGKVSGVRVIDANSRKKSTLRARLVFLCASTVASTQILLNSRSAEFPNGLANRSGALGHYLLDHHLGFSGMGIIPGYMDRYYVGNRPNGIYVPRFRNVHEKQADFLRGYGYQGFAMRVSGQQLASMVPGYGVELKGALRQPGPWMMMFSGFGEILPRSSNYASLHKNKVDRFGIPQMTFHSAHSHNERKMRADMADEAGEMLKVAGAVNIQTAAEMSPFGDAIHEMGTARMGDDPAQSVLNKFNQAHDVSNLFVTDGACMTSGSCVNPSITYMALTARAVDYAVTQLRSGYL